MIKLKSLEEVLSEGKIHNDVIDLNKDSKPGDKVIIKSGTMANSKVVSVNQSSLIYVTSNGIYSLDKTEDKETAIYVDLKALKKVL